MRRFGGALVIERTWTGADEPLPLRSLRCSNYLSPVPPVRCFCSSISFNAGRLWLIDGHML